jgi:pimeloyl-ACP methyl ester carboxylesterase
MKTLPEAGHMVMIERYKEFNDAVLEFLSSLE